MVGRVFGYPCAQTVTPVLSGGTIADTYYTSMDIDSDFKIVAGGACFDGGVCPPASSGSSLPFIHYIIPQGNFVWYKYYKDVWVQYYHKVAQVAFYGAFTVMAVI